MHGLPRRAWQDAFQEAIQEDDIARVEESIQEAESAIFRRIRGFSRAANDGWEERALFEALFTLRNLRAWVRSPQAGEFFSAFHSSCECSRS